MRAVRAVALAAFFLSFSSGAFAGELGRAIAGRAEALVGLPSVAAVARDVPDDCTGLVRLVYGKSGIDLRARATSSSSTRPTTATGTASATTASPMSAWSTR